MTEMPHRPSLHRPLLLSMVLGLALHAGAAGPAAAQPAAPSAVALAELDERVRGHLEENNIPGALVAVASRGELVHLETYGLSNVELGVPVRDSSVFEIGSISKQFVVAAALLQIEEGRLGLDDPIHDHLPGLPGEWLGVTVRQLMNHTSGIPDYETIRSYDVYRFRLTPEEVIRIAQSRPMDFEPGTGWNYSNTGYYVLSMIVERIDGRPLGDVLAARIFDPLGMGQTRMADPEAIIPHRAEGYWVNRVGELINRPATEPSSTLAAGGLLSSAADMARWDAALSDDRLLSDASRELMWAPTTLPAGDEVNYGFGWAVFDYRGTPVRAHNGQVAGFVADFWRLPEQETAIIVFLNRYQVDAMPVTRAVLETFLPGLGDPATGGQ